MRYYRHYQKVKELEHTIMLSTDGMPENADLLENEYQKLLRILSDEYTGAQSRAATRQKKYAGILCHVGSPGQDTDRSTAASASE